MNLEKHYRDENIKYRKLRYRVLISEAKDILNWLFERFGLDSIPAKFQKRVTCKGKSVVAIFLHPEIYYKLQFRFEKEDLELLTLLHEFTHYYVYTNYEYGTYKIHGKAFYSELDNVTDEFVLFYKEKN